MLVAGEIAQHAVGMPEQLFDPAMVGLGALLLLGGRRGHEILGDRAHLVDAVEAVSLGSGSGLGESLLPLDGALVEAALLSATSALARL